MKFEIRNRWTGSVQYTCELTAEVAGLSYGLQLGFAARDAVLRGAVLRGAVLRDADLRGADLRGAVLRDADLRGADLRGAVLREFKADFWMVLLHAQPEVPALLKAIREGRVDGSTYSGECSCLVGTIAAERHVSVEALPVPIQPNSSRPAESFFMAIKRGDTPATNQVSALVEEWTLEFMALTGIAEPKVAP